MDMEKRVYDADRDYAVRSRRIVFEREIKSLVTWMQGGFVHIWPWMIDFQGRYSEEETVAFVDQVLDEGRYRRMYAPDQDSYVRRLSFYRDLLYCILRTLTSGYTEYRAGNVTGFGEPEDVTFSWIFRCLEGDSKALLDCSVVYFMQTLYEIFTEMPIELGVLNPEVEATELTEEMRAEMEEEAGAWSAMEDAVAEEMGYHIEEVRESEQKEEEIRRQQEKKRIRDVFAEKEHFCQSLNKVRKYAREHVVSPGRLQEELKELLFQFLSAENRTIFDEEESYVEVMIQLKRTIRTAQRYTED